MPVYWVRVLLCTQNPPAWTFWVQGLQVCTITPGWPFILEVLLLGFCCCPPFLLLLLSLPSSLPPFIIFVFYLPIFLFFPILLRGSQDRFISFRDSGFNSQCCLKWGCVGTQAYSPYSSRGGPLKIRTLCWVVVSYRPIWTNLDPVSKTTNENLHQR